MQRQFRASCRIGIVRDHDDRLVKLAIEPLHQIEDLACRLGVEITRRFVRDDQRRVSGDGASNRDSLLLATGELARVVMRAVAQADDLQRGLDVLATFASRQRSQRQRQLDVLERREDWDQVVKLKDEADVP